MIQEWITRQHMVSDDFTMWTRTSLSGEIELRFFLETLSCRTGPVTRKSSQLNVSSITFCLLFLFNVHLLHILYSTFKVTDKLSKSFSNLWGSGLLSRYSIPDESTFIWGGGRFDVRYY